MYVSTRTYFLDFQNALCMGEVIWKCKTILNGAKTIHKSINFF